MDYPQLNLLFGLMLTFTLVVNISFRVLLRKMNLPVGLSSLSWVALVLSIFAALYFQVE